MDWGSISSRLEISQILSGLILAAIIAAVSVRFKALSRSGGWGMVIVGAASFGFGGITFAIPLIFFFVSSVFLTFMTSPVKRTAMLLFDKTGPRDFWQVMANGGVAVICVALYLVTGKSYWYYPYLASLAAAAADTWATERGTMSRQTPVSIVTFKRTEPGRSGAVTLAGMISAAAGSLMVMLVGYFTVRIFDNPNPGSVRIWLAVFNAGFAGSILDSILGGSIQAVYRCSLCNKITEKREHCGDSTVPLSGWSLINNDIVNFISVLFASIAVALIFLL